MLHALLKSMMWSTPISLLLSLRNKSNLFLTKPDRSHVYLSLNRVYRNGVFCVGLYNETCFKNHFVTISSHSLLLLFPTPQSQHNGNIRWSLAWPEWVNGKENAPFFVHFTYLHLQDILNILETSCKYSTCKYCDSYKEYQISISTLVGQWLLIYIP